MSGSKILVSVPMYARSGEVGDHKRQSRYAEMVPRTTASPAKPPVSRRARTSSSRSPRELPPRARNVAHSATALAKSGHTR